MTTYVRRKRRTVQRPALLFQTNGAWAPCTDKGEAIEGAQAVKLGIVRGRLHRPMFCPNDLINVTEGEHTGWWKPVFEAAGA